MMNVGLRDVALSRKLQESTIDDPEYWSFRANAVRRHAHALFQYPAMMVPQMLTRLLADLIAIDAGIRSVYDPFVGSGTVLTESMLAGLDFYGRDINPLAILLSRVKAGPFFTSALENRLETILRHVQEDRALRIECKFSGWEKWFNRGIAIRLSRLVRAIRHDNDHWSRRFFWVVLGETVRLSSNSRTSTFKLHMRPKEEIESRRVDPFATFKILARRNIDRMHSLLLLLREAKKVDRGLYKGTVGVELADASSGSEPGHGIRADLLVTSPPYGDNVTTVPYGQYSYLPLQWIDLEDVEHDFDYSFLSTTHEIDTRSLGGKLRGALDSADTLREKSPSFSRTIDALKGLPRDRSVRVAGFCRDLDHCLTPILSQLRERAYMVWIVGNRRVGNQMVPMHSILSELLQARGAVFVDLIERQIPSKRMAVRNDIARTMSCERILVMRNGDC